MTREEAISALKNTAWIGTDKKVGEVEKAIMMAIEAFKAQIGKDTNVPINDCISRQAAIDTVKKHYRAHDNDLIELIAFDIERLPSAQPNLDRKNVSDLMEKIYSIQSPHLSTEGVIARKYYCKQLWMEIFGSEDVPTWMI